MLTCQKCGEDYPDGTRYCTKDGTLLEAVSSDLEAGTEVGEYRITGKLGQGGMGSVFAGVQPVVGKKVAIKVLAKELANDVSMVQRFVQEARAANRIGHPNIIDIFSFGQLPDGRHYYVMELVDGKSLTDILKERRLAFGEAGRLLGQVCSALAAAHAEGIVHRDLKPDNIYVALPKHSEPFVKLLDFGIAKLFASGEAMTATFLPMSGWTPAKTLPIAPWPSLPVIRYSPTSLPSSRSAVGALSGRPSWVQKRVPSS